MRGIVEILDSFGFNAALGAGFAALLVYIIAEKTTECHASIHHVGEAKENNTLMIYRTSYDCAHNATAEYIPDKNIVLCSCPK